MKICILITAHKNGCQLERLVNHLKKDFDIYLHIDKKSKLELKPSKNVRVFSSVNVTWGGFSQVRATLLLLQEAYKIKYDRYIFISGQDVPIKSNRYIITFFSENRDIEYINFINIKDNDYLDIVTPPLINKYHFFDSDMWWYRKFLHSSIRFGIEKIINGLIKRKPLAGVIYYGSSWWNLSNNAVEYILCKIHDKKILARFKHTYGSDEKFFQCILLNSPFRDKCCNDNLRYIDWAGGNGSSPKILTIADYELIKESKAIFARKLDKSLDSVIIDKLYLSL